uniref:ARAD1D06820p n=1 Tax=Blastobotrys adeninivorans TaxID=409370 RepID=A0A060TEF1_BLAAD
MSIPKSQRAWVYECSTDTRSQSFDYVDIPVNSPGFGEVLLKVAACGICRSDLDLVLGQLYIPGRYVLGHEIVGTIAQLGEGISPQLYPDDKLFVVFGPNGCQQCYNCRKGLDNQCSNCKKWYGFGVDGGFEQYIVVREQSLIPVPPGISPQAAAATTDAVLSSYHACMRAQVTAQSSVLVIGVGGLGLNAIQILRNVLGAYTIATNRTESKLESALKFGANKVYHKMPEEPLNVDIVLDFVGTTASWDLARKHARPTGKIVPVGVNEHNLTFDNSVFELMEHQIIGSFWGTSAELVRCLDYVAEGKIVPQVQVCTIDSVKDKLEVMHDGGVNGRFVVVLE